MNEISAGYIRNNFEAADRIAIVLLNKRSGVVLQRVVSAERVVAPEYQAWRRHMNAQNLVQVYLGPRSHNLAKWLIQLMEFVPGEPLEWIVVCQRSTTA